MKQAELLETDGFMHYNIPDTWAKFDADRQAATYLKTKGKRMKFNMHRIDDVATPLEIIEFADRITELQPGGEHENLVKQALAANKLNDLTLNEVQSYQSFILPGKVYFFSGGGQKREKTLLIMMTGITPRMGLPLPGFLQALDSKKYDVVLLNDLKRAFLRRGIAGLDMGIEELPAYLEQNFDASTYQRCVPMGMSMGTEPAFQLGRLGGYERAVGVGLRAWEPALNLTRSGNVAIPDVLFNCTNVDASPCDTKKMAAVTGRETALVCAYGGLNKDDVRDAQKMHARTGCIRYHTIGTAMHNVYYNAFIHGYLPEFLDDLLNCDTSKSGQIGTKPKRIFLGWRRTKSRPIVRLIKSITARLP